MTQITCYTYEADYHCIDCAEERFPMLTELHNNRATDSEGNPIGVVFSTDSDFNNGSLFGGVECGTCFDEIIESESNGYEDQESIHDDFMQNILPMVKEQYEQDGIPDKPARREAFNDWLDSLDIGESIKSMIGHPADLETA